MSETIKSRVELQTWLEAIMGNRNVYFQPPANIQIKVPGVVYNVSDINESTALNEKYKRSTFYNITLMSTDPDPNVLNDILAYRTTKFRNSYPVGGVYHHVISIRI